MHLTWKWQLSVHPSVLKAIRMKWSLINQTLVSLCETDYQHAKSRVLCFVSYCQRRGFHKPAVHNERHSVFKVGKLVICCWETKSNYFDNNIMFYLYILSFDKFSVRTLVLYICTLDNYLQLRLSIRVCHSISNLDKLLKSILYFQLIQ